MCTYETQRIAVTGSAKGRSGWFTLTDGSIYFDHPVHFPAGHALLIDLCNQAIGPEARIAIEMDSASARELANGILSVLDGVPLGLEDASVAT